MNLLKELARKVTEIVNGSAFAKEQSIEGNQTTVYSLLKDGNAAETSRLNNSTKLSAILIRTNSVNK